MNTATTEQEQSLKNTRELKSMEIFAISVLFWNFIKNNMIFIETMTATGNEWACKRARTRERMR